MGELRALSGHASDLTVAQSAGLAEAAKGGNAGVAPV